MFSLSKTSTKNNHSLTEAKKGSDWKTERVTAIKEQPLGQQTRKEELKEKLSVAENTAQSVSLTPGSPDNGFHSRGSQKYMKCKAKVSTALTTIVCCYSNDLSANIPLIKMHVSSATVHTVW